jgi:CheY-like chemotaxis protein
MPLYRSMRGHVACAEHAPLLDVSRWTLEAWHRVPAEELAADPPVQCQRCANEPGQKQRRHPPPRKPLVLNVDDRPASLYARERALRLQGYAVLNAGTAADAIVSAQRVRPSLILLDVHLPDGDGRDVCRQLKADAAVSDIPIVLISATLRAHADNLEGLRWGGADGYVTEPCEWDALASTLRRLIAA